jgi:PAS domain-containing protein
MRQFRLRGIKGQNAMSLGLIELIVAVGCAAILTSMIWIDLWALLPHGMRRRENGANDAIVFLLGDDTVTDMSTSAEVMAKRLDKIDPDRDALIGMITGIFPDLDPLLAEDGVLCKTLDAPEFTGVKLDADRNETRLILSIYSQTDSALIDDFCARTENAELLRLRTIVKNAPDMMWRTDDDGNLAWANDAFLGFSDACTDDDHGLPRLSPETLFSDCDLASAQPDQPVRCSLKTRESDAPHWFDITTIKTESGAFHYASDANGIVRAELAQRKFMQTLNQTFAQLSIGLAIFDRKRQLATFNPALLDMTGLNFEFLSGRPTLDALLDRLRDMRMLPEPKDYASWREQYSAMEKAAKARSYSEHWNLPDGQTFRVTGRPHPDGAFALLFEDISAEVSLTRRFRSEIKTSQAVLDNLNDAIAVFSNSGNLVLANAAYCDLCGTDLTNGLMQCDLRVELRKWQDRCTPTRIWTNLREFSKQLGRRQTWTDTTIMDDGRQITCQAEPIAGGMTMMHFRFEAPLQPTLQKLTQRDDALLAIKG